MTHFCFWQKEDDGQETEQDHSCYDVEEPLNLEGRPNDERSCLAGQRRKNPEQTSRYCNNSTCMRTTHHMYNVLDQKACSQKVVTL